MEKKLETYQATCLRLGLLDDDGEIDRAKEEAVSLKFGNQLRELFVNVLIWVRPADPKQFYERHKQSLGEDFKNMSHEEAENETLTFLQKQLSRYDLELQRDFGLPRPCTSGRIPAELRDELGYDIESLTQIHCDNVRCLTVEQRYIYNAVIDSVDNNKALLISLDACGGTGKTFVLTTILAFLRSWCDIALATAASGIAATLLPNGRTLHSRLKVPINIKEESTCNIAANSATVEFLRRCKLLVIDEVTMAHRHVYEGINRTLRDIRNDERSYGSLMTVFAGDWHQILPVVRRGSRADIVDACFKSSPLWEHITIMKLTRNMRVAQSSSESEEDATFADHILQLGEGRIQVHDSLGRFKIQLKNSFVLDSPLLEELCEFAFHTYLIISVIHPG